MLQRPSASAACAHATAHRAAVLTALTVANFVVPEGEAVAPLMHAKGAVALTDSTFANNSLPGTAAGAVFVSGAGALRLERTAFTGTTSDHAVLAATPRNAVYSDDSAATYAVLAQGAGTAGGPGGGRTVQTRPTRVLSAAREEPFLLGNDTWILALQQVLGLALSRPHAKRGPNLVRVTCERARGLYVSHMTLPLLVHAYTWSDSSSRHACLLRLDPSDGRWPARHLSAGLRLVARRCREAQWRFMRVVWGDVLTAGGVQELRLQPAEPLGPDGGDGSGDSSPDTSGALVFVGFAAAAIVGLAICCVACVCVRRRCSRLGQKDSIDSEPDFWTSNVSPFPCRPSVADCLNCHGFRYNEYVHSIKLPTHACSRTAASSAELRS